MLKWIALLVALCALFVFMIDHACHKYFEYEMVGQFEEDPEARAHSFYAKLTSILYLLALILSIGATAMKIASVSVKRSHKDA